ncbi:MAG: phage holin family protein [Chthoniobacterales bacterium]
MAGRPMPFRNPAGYGGLRQNLLALIASLTQFFQSRLQLAAQESKAASRHLIVLVACAVAAAALLFFGYVFLIVFVVVGIAHLCAVSWIWIALIFALLHFIAALLCLVVARAQVKHPMFRETASVLKEDTEWLKNLDQKKTP